MRSMRNTVISPSFPPMWEPGFGRVVASPAHPVPGQEVPEHCGRHEPFGTGNPGGCMERAAIIMAASMRFQSADPGTVGAGNRGAGDQGGIAQLNNQEMRVRNATLNTQRLEREDEAYKSYGA